MQQQQQEFPPPPGPAAPQPPRLVISDVIYFSRQDFENIGGTAADNAAAAGGRRRGPFAVQRCGLCSYRTASMRELMGHLDTHGPPPPPSPPPPPPGAEDALRTMTRGSSRPTTFSQRFPLPGAGQEDRRVRTAGLVGCRLLGGRTGGGGGPYSVYACEKCSYRSASFLRIRDHMVTQHGRARSPGSSGLADGTGFVGGAFRASRVGSCQG